MLQRHLQHQSIPIPISFRLYFTPVEFLRMFVKISLIDSPLQVIKAKIGILLLYIMRLIQKKPKIVVIKLVGLGNSVLQIDVKPTILAIQLGQKTFGVTRAMNFHLLLLKKVVLALTLDVLAYTSNVNKVHFKWLLDKLQEF